MTSSALDSIDPKKIKTLEEAVKIIVFMKAMHKLEVKKLISQLNDEKQKVFYVDQLRKTQLKNVENVIMTINMELHESEKQITNTLNHKLELIEDRSREINMLKLEVKMLEKNINNKDNDDSGYGEEVSSSTSDDPKKTCYDQRKTFLHSLFRNRSKSPVRRNLEVVDKKITRPTLLRLRSAQDNYELIQSNNEVQIQMKTYNEYLTVDSAGDVEMRAAFDRAMSTSRSLRKANVKYQKINRVRAKNLQELRSVSVT